MVMESWWESVRRKAYNLLRASVLDNSAMLQAILFKFRLQDHIVRDCPQEHFQAGYVRRRLDNYTARLTDDDLAELKQTGQIGDPSTAITASLGLDYPNEEDLPSCNVCLALHGRLGKQEIVFDQREFSYHIFALTSIGLDGNAWSATQ